MRIHIRQIRPEGIELCESFSLASMGLTEADTLRFVAPVEVKALVTRVGNDVLAKVTATSCYESFCGRCLEEVKQAWTTEFLLDFEVPAREEFIEVDEEIRQEFILNLPTNVLCQAACKGLCIKCGVNLNKEKCNHV